MKFSLPLPAFRAAAKVAADVADAKIQPRLGNLQVNFGDGTATVAATDLTTTVVSNLVGVSADPELDSFVVEAALLSRILETLSGEQLEGVATDNAIRFAEFSLPSPNNEDLPNPDALPTQGSASLPPTFSEMLGGVLPAMLSFDNKWGSTSCLMIDVGGPSVKLACCDGKRAAVYTSGAADKKARIRELLVPGKEARRIQGLCRQLEAKELSWSASSVSISFGNTRLTTRQGVGKFPPYNLGWPAQLGHEASYARDVLKAAVNQAGLLVSGDTVRLQCLFGSTGLEMSYVNEQRRFKKQVPATRSSGPGAEVSLSQPLLKAFLDAAQSNEIGIAISDKRDMVLCTAGDHYSYMFMPLEYGNVEK